jgi:hypothetical protein
MFCLHHQGNYNLSIINKYVKMPNKYVKISNKYFLYPINISAIFPDFWGWLILSTFFPYFSITSRSEVTCLCHTRVPGGGVCRHSLTSRPMVGVIAVIVSLWRVGAVVDGRSRFGEAHPSQTSQSLVLTPSTDHDNKWQADLSLVNTALYSQTTSSWQ